MDYVALLKRAFQITIKYRALWIFGFFLALCSASGSGGNGSSGSSSGGDQSFGEGFGEGSFDMPFDALPNIDFWPLMGGVIAVLLCLILFVIVVGIVVRAVTRTALIGMVDQVEETEAAATIKDGWRIGWSKRAWTVFLINFVITVPLIIIFGALLLIALSPFMLALLENTALLVLGIVAGIGLMLLWILAVIVVSIVISPFQELGWRYAVLHQTGAIESLKASYALIRQNLKDVGIIVLLLIGVAIVWIVASIVLTIIVVLLGLFIGVIPGLLAFLITQTWWVALAVGILVLVVIITLSMTFIQGLYLIFRSAMWTLTFRELMLTDRLRSESVGIKKANDEGDVE